MEAIIVIVVFIITLVGVLSKHSGQQKSAPEKQKKPGSVQQTRPVQNKHPGKEAARRTYAQYEAARNAQKQKEDILTRAKRNVAEYQEDKLDDLESEGYHEKTTGFHMAHKPYQPVEDTGEPEAKDTILYQDMEDGEDLMNAVYDVMVKGVDCSIPFERDFIAEGQEMLNRIYS